LGRCLDGMLDFKEETCDIIKHVVEKEYLDLFVIAEFKRNEKNKLFDTICESLADYAK